MTLPSDSVGLVTPQTRHFDEAISQYFRGLDRTDLSMPLLALGVNHSTAPVAFRERVSFVPETVPEALREIRDAGGVREVLDARGYMIRGDRLALRYELRFSYRSPDEIHYWEDIVLQIRGQGELFHHTDENTLRRVK